jgi:FkbM family methyltransferase
MSIPIIVNNVLKQIGFEIKRYPNSDLRRRINLINHFSINKIFDVGASVGNYALEMRKLGFNGEIVSFEPLSISFQQLLNKSKKDKFWQAINVALGDFDGKSIINIAANSDSSSLLAMLPQHVKSAPESIYKATEEITVNRIDSIFENFYMEGDNLYLKIDTQGFELAVLEGAKNTLGRFTGIQLEMSIVPLYKGAGSYYEMIDYLNKNGFYLFSIENGFYDKLTGRLLQFDAVFFRSSE